MSEYTVFLASSQDGASHEEMRKQVSEAFRKAAPHTEVAVVMEEEMAPWLLSEDEWATHISHGVDPMFKTPLFNAIVCPEESVNQETYQIVEKALKNRKMVACVLDETTIRRVVSVSGDESTGWRVCTQS
jgi:hypothetical protein